MGLKYSEYLKSPSWKKLRKLAYQRSNHSCDFCGNEAVAVHHVKYPKKYNEDCLDNLIVVCKKCHELTHGLRESDKKNIYLAGKVGGIKWKVVEKIPFHRFYSSDGTNHSSHEWGYNLSWEMMMGDGKDPVQEYIIDKVDGTDMLIAVLDKEISYGSIAEIAWFAAKGKPCYMIIIGTVDDNCETDPEGNKFYKDIEGVIPDCYWLVASLPNVSCFCCESKEMATKKVCELLGVSK
jgi:hypothetical protein